MNIFPINENPQKAVVEMCDQHVVKIISEAVLVYNTAVARVKPEEWNSSEVRWGFVNIPLAAWAENETNRKWLACYIDELIKEYSYRYGGKSHKAGEAFYAMTKACGETPNGAYPKNINFLQVMPDEFKTQTGNGVKAYRNYYLFKFKEGFKRPMRWTKRTAPSWLK